jgi:hypothetical protein
MCKVFFLIQCHHMSVMDYMVSLPVWMVTMGILPYQGKIPMAEPGIEPRTSCLVVRNTDH